MRRAILLLLILGACTPDFDEVWEVQDLRILAIQAEPPEVLISLDAPTIPQVAIQPLVVDPTLPQDASLEWELWACPEEEELCKDEATRELVHRQSSPLSEIGASFTPSRELLTRALELDPFGGLGGVPILLDLRVEGPTHTALGIKRVVYGLPDPPEKTANRNPDVAEVTADGQPIQEPLHVEPDQVTTLLPRPAADAREAYVVRTFEGSTRELEEFLSYRYYTTAGELSHAITGGKPNAFVDDAKVTDVSADWTAPPLQQQATIWIVVHDDRGGVGWSSISATIDGDAVP
jgi:hypothetical protein